MTGSAVPAKMKEISHTGTGRISRMKMRPMSLFESEDSNGTVSLQDLFEQNNIAAENSIDIEKFAFLICRGGWPKSLDCTDKIALQQSIDYFDAVVESDVSKVDGISRNAERTKLILRSYSRNIGTQAKLTEILKDVTSNESDTFTIETLYSYLNALKKIFVIKESPYWNPNLRSKTAVRTTETRYFADPSIATASLGLGPKDLISDLNTMGLLFENLCIRDLRVYEDFLDGNIYHYRDKKDLECDAVLHRRDGTYGLIEIKLGGDKLIEEGVKNLISLRTKIDTTKMKDPSFLMILTGVGLYAYRRKDGIYIVPIECLKN